MMERILPIAGILALGFLYTLYQSWVYRDKDDKGPEMTGPATVKSHKVVQGGFMGKATGRWNYMVTFTLSDGEEIELYTILSDYQTLQDGISGQLTWQGKRFYSFDPND